MATDKTELRGMCPTDLATALDAIAMAKGVDRNTYVVHVLSEAVTRYLREANVVQRALQGNPLLEECEGRVAG